MYFQGLEKAVHVWVSWKVCILLPNFMRLAHSMTRKVDKGSPSLTSKRVHIGSIKGKIVRPIFTVRLDLQEACNWISIPLEPQLILSLHCSSLAVPGSVKRQKAMLDMAHMISIHQTGSLSSIAACRLQPDDRNKKNRGEIRNALCCCSTSTRFALQIPSTTFSELVQGMGNIFVCLQPSLN